MALSTSDKIQLVTYPPLPSRCCICKSNADGVKEFLDWNYQIEYEGSINICTECAVNIGQVVDMVSKEQFKEKNEQVNELLGERHSLDSQNARYREFFDLLLSIRTDLIPESAFVDGHLPNLDQIVEATSTGSTNPVGLTDSVLVEATDAEGRTNSELIESDSSGQSENVSQSPKSISLGL